MPTVIDKTISETHLLGRISLGRKQSYCRKRLHKRSALTEIHSTMEALPQLERNYTNESLHSGSPLTVETYYINAFNCTYSVGNFGRNTTAPDRDEIGSDFRAFPSMSSQYLCGKTSPDMPISAMHQYL
jgi:hypothetical protein